MSIVYSVTLESSRSIFSFPSNRGSVTRCNTDMMLVFALRAKHSKTSCHIISLSLQEIFLLKKAKPPAIIDGSQHWRSHKWVKCSRLHFCFQCSYPTNNLIQICQNMLHEDNVPHDFFREVYDQLSQSLAEIIWWNNDPNRSLLRGTYRCSVGRKLRMTKWRRRSEEFSHTTYKGSNMFATESYNCILNNIWSKHEQDLHDMLTYILSLCPNIITPCPFFCRILHNVSNVSVLGRSHQGMVPWKHIQCYVNIWNVTCLHQCCDYKILHFFVVYKTIFFPKALVPEMVVHFFRKSSNSSVYTSSDHATSLWL